MKRLSTRFIAGIIIIIIGVVALLSNIGVPYFENAFGTWWPSLIVLWGAFVFMNNPRNYFWSAILVIFGAAWQLEKFEVIDFSPWQIVWPVLIILIGGSLLFSRKDSPARLDKQDRHDVTAILSGSEIKNGSPDFKGGKVTSVMGGAQLDLRKATIKKSATIEVFAFWGGIEIFAPSDVLVKNQTNVILGGIEDTTASPADEKAPVLHIVGDVIMAGVEVKN